MLHRSISAHDQVAQQTAPNNSKLCGAAVCNIDATCCDLGPTGICGGPESTCCYNPNTMVANLCDKYSSCNTNTGHCFSSAHGQFQCGKIACTAGSTCCDEAPAALCGGQGSTCCYNPEKTIANLCDPYSTCNPNSGNCFASAHGEFACGMIACAAGSVCCDEAPAALCGSPGSTCCYDPLKQIANLCAPGSFCLPTGNCVAR